MGALAQVQAMAAADRLLTVPPTIGEGEAWKNLDDADRRQLLGEVLVDPTGRPHHQAEGWDTGLAQAGAAPDVDTDEIDQLFNEGWMTGLDG